MSKPRKKRARLGRVAPSASISERKHLWNVLADSKCVHFRQLWGRDDDVVTVPLSDILDFGINRRIESGARAFRVGFSNAGIYFREEGRGHDIIVTYQDLVSLIGGQRFIPGTIA
jgi:hypothetical protein